MKRYCTDNSRQSLLKTNKCFKYISNLESIPLMIFLIFQTQACLEQLHNFVRQ